MEDTTQRFTLRMPKEIMDKISYIAEFEGRTKNKQIEIILKRYINEFELSYGEIDERIKRKM